MNILQKIESKLTPKFTDEAVDKELEDYTVEAIRHRLKSEKRYLKIIRFIYPLLLPSLVLLLFWPITTVATATIAFVFSALLLTSSIRAYRNLKIKQEALESGLKRKIENNKGEEL
ncbi:hypothetical protein [Salinicola aestuarinus]|uniref:hypothetical protein n=1 Tax=Salinicola aestuarinus TaxID=1949082 RepID=UPI0013007A14|nr:hypothetical protein [Salinicola aestuarinus]